MIRVALAAILSSSLLTFPTLASEVNVSGSTSVARVMVLSQRLFMTRRQKSPDTITLRERKI